VSRKNILFCYCRIPSFTNAVRDYVLAFGDYSRHRIHYYDMDSGPLDFPLEPFDAIIFNYCFWARRLPLAEYLHRKVSDFNGLKIAIFQDEYDYFLWHEKTVLAFGIDVIVTGVPEKHWRDVFRDEAFRKVTFVNALTGYVNDGHLGQSAYKPLEARQWVLGYRSRATPFTYGRLTQEKVLIGRKMKELCRERGIAANIEVSEESRIYGPAWPEFLGSCRAVLGTESGSNVFDFDGTVKPAIEAFVAANPDAEFEMVYDKFLRDVDGRIHMNQVSPRVFETIAMRTGLVLFEGEYSGVVRPWEHYIQLKKDFSNADQVFAALDDTSLLDQMIQRAYDDVIASGKYHFKAYIARLDDHISARCVIDRNYEPCFGLVGWRSTGDSPIHVLPGQRMQVPMTRPLRHFDVFEDPIVEVKFNRGALYRTIVRWFNSVAGKKIKRRLQENQKLYRALRKLVWRLTGKW
jgi:hypothetical protein